MDIKTTFLHGDLSEEVYMDQPVGGKEPGKEDWASHLNKTLYGLMQAACGWNQHLHRNMVNNGYTRILSDHGVYIRTSKLGTSIVAIHVDDMCAAASSAEEVKKLKDNLRKAFNLVDLSEVHFLLGIAITWDWTAHTITLSQKAYVEKITKCLHLKDAHPVATPLDPNVILFKSLCPDTDEAKALILHTPYLTVVGLIMYVCSNGHTITHHNCTPNYISHCFVLNIFIWVHRQLSQATIVSSYETIEEQHQ